MVKISWSNPKNRGHYDFTGFVVSWSSEGSLSRNINPTHHTTAGISKGVNNYKINGLVSCMKHEISVYAKNKYGDSERTSTSFTTLGEG